MVDDMKGAMFIFIFMLLCINEVNAVGHIGNREVVSIRMHRSDYVVAYLTTPIDNVPSCATSTTAIVLDMTGDQNWRNRQFSSLLTAVSGGLKINPMCTDQCVNIWADVYLVKCSDMWLIK